MAIKIACTKMSKKLAFYMLFFICLGMTTEVFLQQFRIL